MPSRREVWRSRRYRLDVKGSPYVYVAPFFILFAAFGLYPLLYTAFVSLHSVDLGNPDIGWVRLAESLGVEGAATGTLEGCGELMAQSFKRPGPFLIELSI